jgi:hypothetical protein
MSKQNTGLIDIAFFIRFPIQLSTFLFTLVKKRIIDNFTSAFLYNISLLLIYFVRPWSNLDIIIIFTIIFSRFKLRINKYIIWIIIGVLGQYLSY